MAPNGCPKLSIVIPAYNEQFRIGGSLKKINEFLLDASFPAEILVVDDGSADLTHRVLQQIKPDMAVPLRIIRFPENRGKGAAVREGVLAAQGECILFTDADLSTPIVELLTLLTRLGQEEADIVIGSRGLPDSNITVRQNPLRQLSGKIFNRLIRLLTRMPFRDTQCGFKLFRQEVARELFSELSFPGFAFDVEILFHAGRRGYKVLEVPVTWANSEGSRVRFFRDSLRMFSNLVRLRWSARKPRD
ncbi:MAG: glycosyltransferase family 2 protein [Acidobacteria bacterium]|nr:glycosyltransferase family 2 protein [Acidobacteriota bacterium]